ncbi:MAG TPA: RidA family protein [Ramlibacter sp.]|nr:RidA family protein [Ramlibacter sp.]
MAAFEHINPAGLPPPPGGIYSHLVRAGDQLYVSGQLARDKEGNLVGLGDVAAQYRQVWANLQTALAAVGLGVEDLVKTTTYVVGEGNIAAMRVVRREMSSPNPPTSTMVVVAALAVPGALVEVDAIASFAAKSAS